MHKVDSSRQIGYIVRRQRSEAGLTQKQLAKQAGVSERLVISLELGDATGIRLDKLLQVLSALDLSLAVVDAGCESDRGSEGGSEDGEKPEGHVQYAVVDFSDYPINLDLPASLSLSAFKEGS